jgi:hypothetical protein
MALTDQAVNSLASHLYRNVLFNTPQIYLGLLRADEQELESSSNPGYARVRLDTAMAAPVEGLASNDTEVILPGATANWADTVVAIGIWAALTEGQLLQTITLHSPVDVLVAQAIRFPVGAIELGFAKEPQFIIADKDERIAQAAQNFVQTSEITSQGDPSINAANTFSLTAETFVQTSEITSLGDPSMQATIEYAQAFEFDPLVEP